MWVVFALTVISMLVLDLGVFQRKAHAPSAREAGVWVAVWVALALLFNLGIYFKLGEKTALEFLTGYVIEEALSVDNLFVFFIIFGYFAVPGHLQHRALFWGIVGAVVIRGAFIFVGTSLMNAFHWMIYLFGGFLIFTGIKILFGSDSKVDPEKNPALRLARKLVPLSKDYVGQKFFARVDGRLLATPLFLVLVVIETTDIVFAVDSIPAVMAVTTDPLVIFTSNIFAILGLRSMYFLLSRVIDKFRYLKVGLGVVLAFVGTKMVIADWVHIPVQASLGVVVGVLLLAALASAWIKPKPEQPAPTGSES